MIETWFLLIIILGGTVGHPQVIVKDRSLCNSTANLVVPDVQKKEKQRVTFECVPITITIPREIFKSLEG